MNKLGKYLIFKILSGICCLSLIGCAGSLYEKNPNSISASNYVDIETFCEANVFKYRFDTVDDIVNLYSSEKEVKVLLNSLVGSINGSAFCLNKPPVYYGGKIFLPRELKSIVFSRKPAAFRPLFTINTVVVDPGHGGKDPGAISSSGMKEKDLNLSVSNYLKERLEREGFKVILTRTKDVFLSLRERVDIAKKHDADLFISIHANANNSRKVSGVEVYYLTPSKINSSERSIKLAKSEKFNGKDLPFNVKAILWDLLITKNYSFSVELSNVLYFNFKSLGLKVRPPIKAPFYVLRYACVPSILVEAGYLSNYYEEKALRKKYYQKQIAEAVALSIVSLKKRYTDIVRNDAQ